jgi:hypothetical protein
MRRAGSTSDLVVGNQPGTPLLVFGLMDQSTPKILILIEEEAADFV